MSAKTAGSGTDPNDFASGVSSLFGSLAGAITGHAVSGPRERLPRPLLGRPWKKRDDSFYPSLWEQGNVAALDPSSLVRPMLPLKP